MSLSVNSSIQTNVVLIGNPGVGKSTILNGLVGEIRFKAGFSMMKGLTQALQKEEHKRVRYIDTPGLDDVEIRDKAAKEIQTALQTGGRFKIIFVMTLEGGRIRGSDSFTVQTVLENLAIPSKQLSYAIIFNKTSKNDRDRIFADENNKMILFEYFNKSMKAPPSEIIFLDKRDELEGHDNVLMKPDPEVMELLLHMPEMEIPSTAVHDFQFSSSVVTTRRRHYEAKMKELDQRVEQYEHYKETIHVKVTRTTAKKKMYKVGAGNKVHCEHCQFCIRSYKKKIIIDEYALKDRCLVCFDCCQ